MLITNTNPVLFLCMAYFEAFIDTKSRLLEQEPQTY